MKTVFGVPYIEVECGWGSRPWGWKLFPDIETAATQAALDSNEGPSDGGYLGPERPIYIYEIPADSLPKDFLERIDTNWYHTDDYWTPRFKNLVRNLNG